MRSDSILAYTNFLLLSVIIVISAQKVDEIDKTEFTPYQRIVAKEPQSSELEDEKRSPNTRNPYSWQNTDKRSRNPYSWMSSFYDTSNTGPYNQYMSKKSQQNHFAWLSDYKRTRNPYSWMNFI